MYTPRPIQETVLKWSKNFGQIPDSGQNRDRQNPDRQAPDRESGQNPESGQTPDRSVRKIEQRIDIGHIGEFGG